MKKPTWRASQTRCPGFFGTLPDFFFRVSSRQQKWKLNVYKVMSEFKPHTIKRPHLSATLFILGLLLLFSPCSVRNSLQHVLKLEVHQTSGKYKATLEQNHNCKVPASEYAAVSEGKTKVGDCPACFPDVYFHLPPVSGLSFRIPSPDNTQRITTPLYILFKRLKCMA